MADFNIFSENWNKSNVSMIQKNLNTNKVQNNINYFDNSLEEVGPETYIRKRYEKEMNNFYTPLPFKGTVSEIQENPEANKFLFLKLKNDIEKQFDKLSKSFNILNWVHCFLRHPNNKEIESLERFINFFQNYSFESLSSRTNESQSLIGEIVNIMYIDFMVFFEIKDINGQVNSLIVKEYDAQSSFKIGHVLYIKPVEIIEINNYKTYRCNCKHIKSFNI